VSCYIRRQQAPSSHSDLSQHAVDVMHVKGAPWALWSNMALYYLRRAVEGCGGEPISALNQSQVGKRARRRAGLVS
jgi:hypothetical protein